MAGLADILQMLFSQGIGQQNGMVQQVGGNDFVNNLLTQTPRQVTPGTEEWYMDHRIKSAQEIQKILHEIQLGIRNPDGTVKIP